ncbi:hypothetical protein EIP86_008779 [Pleurotus ostreatoroseus]|nr:hypothetical protein EIP86_008779 [Pleurotus ostreatoroseus]
MVQENERRLFWHLMNRDASLLRLILRFAGPGSLQFASCRTAEGCVDVVAESMFTASEQYRRRSGQGKFELSATKAPPFESVLPFKAIEDAAG